MVAVEHHHSSRNDHLTLRIFLRLPDPSLTETTNLLHQYRQLILNNERCLPSGSHIAGGGWCSSDRSRGARRIGATFRHRDGCLRRLHVPGVHRCPGSSRRQAVCSHSHRQLPELPGRPGLLHLWSPGQHMPLVPCILACRTSRTTAQEDIPLWPEFHRSTKYVRHQVGRSLSSNCSRFLRKASQQPLGCN